MPIFWVKYITFLKKKLQSKYKLIKSLMNNQTMILEKISRQDQTQNSNKKDKERFSAFDIISESFKSKLFNNCVKLY